MTIQEGTHIGVWKDSEPRFFLNFGIHIDIQSKNVILYILWWKILAGRYTCEIEQPHWDKVL